MEEVKIYQGQRETWHDEHGQLMTHCPWCGHPSRYARSRVNEHGEGIGAVFNCRHCPTWFDEEGRGVLPQYL